MPCMRRFLILAIVVAACTSQATPPLSVAVIAEQDSLQARAATLAVQHLDAEGGVNGQPVHLTIGTKDDIAGATVVISESLVSGAETAVIVPNAREADLGTAIRLTAPETVAGRALADLLIEDGVTSVAVIAMQDPAVGEALLAAFAQAGGIGDLFTVDDPESASLQPVIDADPDAIVCLCTLGQGPTLLRRAFTQGLMGHPWYYGPSMSDPAVPAQTFPEDPGRLAGQRGVGWDPSSPAGFERFAQEFQAAHEAAPDLATARFYDAVVLAAIAAQAGGIAPSQIRATIGPVSRDGQPCVRAECLPLLAEDVDVDYVGASGDLNLSDQGAPEEVTVVVWRFTLSGEVEVLEDRRVQP